MANSAAEQIVAGMTVILQNRDIVRYDHFYDLCVSITYQCYSSQTEWNVVFATLQSTISHPEAARSTFNLVLSFVTDGDSQWVTPDNFYGLIALLDAFATSAGHLVTVPQKGRRIVSQPPSE